MTQRGKFITIEGIEGVGKSTVVQSIMDFLAAQSIDAIKTREPGGTNVAEQIREVLLHPASGVIDDKTELLLIFACRAQHVAHVILPAIELGEWVVCDRFTDASYAYQGGGRGLANESIAALETFVQEDFRPDKVILLDAPIDVARARVAARGVSLDRIEQEACAFFQRVRDKYLERAHAEPERYAIIDATQTLSEVEQAVQAVLAGLVEHD